MCFIISSPIFTCVMSFCYVIFAVSYAKQSVSIHVCVIHALRVIQYNVYMMAVITNNGRTFAISNFLFSNNFTNCVMK